MHLQNFISTFYFWPDISLDNEDDVTSVLSADKTTYLGKLRDYAFAYSSGVDKHMRQFGDDAVLKDRPNSHRLIELAVHTVPLYGHGRLTSELILELTHAFFKSWFNQNTHNNSHITALNLFISRIWSSNLFVLYQMWQSNGKSTNSMSFHNLFRLFFGETAALSYLAEKDNDDVQELLEKFTTQLDSIMRPPVSDMLVDNIPTSLLAESVTWIARNKLAGGLDHTVHKSLQHLANYIQRPIELVQSNTIRYDCTTITVLAKYGIGQRTYQYKTIYKGTPIAFHVSAAELHQPFINTISNGKGKLVTVVVHSIFQYKKDAYISAYDLEQDSESHYTINRNKIRTIRLQTGISRLAYVFQGLHGVLQDRNNPDKINKGNCLLDGDNCHLLFRKQGYPPCLG